MKPWFGWRNGCLLYTSSQEEVAEQDQILQITSTTGQVTEVDLTQLSISERTSNGSFVNDTISDQEVFSATIK